MTLDHQEHQERLEEFFRTENWRDVLRPAIRRRMRDLERQCARGLKLPEEELRRHQMRYSVLEDVLERPLEFFALPEAEPASPDPVAPAPAPRRERRLAQTR
ncbi:MAG TPA: hypothetical protein VGC92_13690 [Phenylobacterium sp.]